MTTTPADAPRSASWFSALFSPRETIARVVAAEPRRHLWLLASLGLAGSVITQLMLSGWGTALLDWRPLVALAVGAALLGIVALYYSGFFFSWSGRLFGGQASPQAVRAALAWGQIPAILGAAICVVALLIARPAGASGVFETAVTIIVIVAGLWALIATLQMLSRVQNFGGWRTIASGILAWIVAWLVLAVVLVMPIRAFLLQPFNIPSGSMIPTLQVGDYMFVSKYSYGFTHYSLPFSPPLFSGRIFAAEPRRGDVVVYRLPRDPSVDYVSRVVGLPGDRIQMIDGWLNINGKPVERTQIEDFLYSEPGEAAKNVKRWRETLPEGATHETLDLAPNGFYDNTPVYTVPAGHYFMMGDNRDNATDSRVLNRVGYIPFENLIGRVAFIAGSMTTDPATGARSVSFGRFGVVR